MQPRRKQGPLRSLNGAPPASRPSPVIKKGAYVPLAILLVKGDKLENYHLPQKLFALKDFDQGQIMRDYFFQHPQQPVALDPNKPNVAAFNGAVCNFSNWLVKNGYCEKRGTTDVIAHLWTPEEMATWRKEQAELREAAVLAHAEKMAAAGEEGMVISEGINNLLGAAETVSATAGKLYAEGSLDKHEHNEPVNVGTIGHVDHGIAQMTQVIGKVIDGPADESALAQLVAASEADPYAEAAQRSVSDGGQAFERAEGSLLPETEAYLQQERPAHRLDVLLEKPLGYDAAPRPQVDLSGDAADLDPPPVKRLHLRDLELGIISESTVDHGTDYPHLRHMNKEQLDAYFAANPGVETAAAAAVQVADTIAQVQDDIGRGRPLEDIARDTYGHLSEAELLAADPKAGL